MPSLNQITNGLVDEAIVQLMETMGDVEEQQAKIIA